MTVDNGFKTIAGVGSPVVDQVAHVSDDFLDTVAGEKGGMVLVDAQTLDDILATLPHPPVRAPGGSAGNTTFALAQLGVSTRFFGIVGNDAAGSYYRDTFARLGGDASRIYRRDAMFTAQCLSLVTPDGERTMRTHLGAAASMELADITPDAFTGCRHVHIEGYLLFNRDLLVHVLQTAKSAGCSISLDLASFEVVNNSKERLPDLLKKYVNIVFANEEEAEAYAGSNNADDCLKKLAEGCETVAIKFGTAGALLHNAQETCRVSAIPVEDVVDTTGAGDLWAAGFLFGHINGHSLEQCGEFGSVLGAAVVQQEGGSIPEDQWDLIAHRLAA
ncbi:MAG: adenosine kinase [Desulfobacteraceae bacterium]|jgi:sugar/nucleoside kinase (ribokinase family)